MYFIGAVLTIVLIFGGFTLAEVLFYILNKRFFWRAFTPSYIRFTLFPDDKIELDCYDILTEYMSLMLYGTALVIPFIAMNYMGLIKIF
jgi:hypothetical protein